MTEEEIRAELSKMENSELYATESAYRANADLWPGNRISFTDSHLVYLRTHPALQPRHYLSNLRLKTKKRG